MIRMRSDTMSGIVLDTHTLALAPAFALALARARAQALDLSGGGKNNLYTPPTKRHSRAR